MSGCPKHVRWLSGFSAADSLETVSVVGTLELNAEGC